ncbi:MAG: GAF domain-containing protein [Planctomycetes bacterium]|nr:GAF domain-containing protein [Planctomycetota bacterium]
MREPGPTLNPSGELARLREDREELQKSFLEYKRFGSQIGLLRTYRTQEEAWEQILHIARSIVPLRHHRLLLRQEGRRGYAVSRESDQDLPDPSLLAVPEEEIEWVMKNKRVSVIPLDEPRLQEWGAHSRILVPLVGKVEEIGVLVLWVPLPESEVSVLAAEMLSTLGREAAIDIENLRLYGEIERVGSLMNNVLESVPYGIVAIDLSDRIVALNTNAEYLFRIRRFFAVHERYQNVFTPQVAQVLTELIVSTLRGQETVDYEFEHQPDGKTILQLGISTSILYDNQGKPCGLLFLCRDMSLSREVQKLRELDQMKTEFVHTVSHELKTPLTAILGGAEILLYDADKFTAEQLEIIKIIDEGGKRLQNLINDLLDLSRLESGRVELNLAENSLADVTKETMDLLHGRGTVTIAPQFPPDLPAVRFDRDKVKQVVENFLSNAVKYSPGGGEVRVRIYVEDAWIRLDVQDQGLGIPADQLPLVWEKFYRVDSSSTAEIEGTGLGLPIAKHIIDMHKGEIWAESEEGVGSTFSFRLPLSIEAEGP